MPATMPMQQAPQPPGGGQPQPLTAQQVQQMQLVVKQAMQMLLEKNTADSLVARCKQAGPGAPQLVGQLVAPLLARISESAKAAGVEVGMVTMMVAGVQIISTIAEMLWHAGVLESEQALPQFIAAACKASVDTHNASVQEGAAQPGAQQPPPGAAQPQQPGGMLMQGAPA